MLLRADNVINYSSEGLVKLTGTYHLLPVEEHNWTTTELKLAKKKQSNAGRLAVAGRDRNNNPAREEGGVLSSLSTSTEMLKYRERN